jgi:hypothetical protein
MHVCMRRYAFALSILFVMCVMCVGMKFFNTTSVLCAVMILFEPQKNTIIFAHLRFANVVASRARFSISL